MHPLAASHLPGLQGHAPAAAWRCEEVLERQPGGGAHHWIRVRKEGLSTGQVRGALARAAGVPEDEVACAGNRDRTGTCIQWFSIPQAALEHPGALNRAGAQGRMQVLSVQPGAMALAPELVARLRWQVRLVGAAVDQGYPRARAILDHLRLVGVPNVLPEPRADPDGILARAGRLLALGRPLPPALQRAQREPGRCLRAFQEQLFTRYLVARLADGLFARCVVGDRVRTRAGEEVLVEDAEAGQRRLDSWEAVVLGPLPGAGMAPVAGPAAAREDALLAEAGLDAAAMARLKGSRRAVRAQPQQVQLDPLEEDLQLTVELPVETPISALLAELLRAPEPGAPPPAEEALPAPAVARPPEPARHRPGQRIGFDRLRPRPRRKDS